MQIKLSEWQTKVFEDNHRYKVINCGRRAGKSTLTAVEMIRYAHENKNSTVWYIAPTYRQAKQIMWSMLSELIPEALIYRKNETELIFFLKNGSRIELKGAEDPDKLRGARIDLAVFDEVAFFTRWVEVWKVIRPTLADSQAQCWFISTPNGFNHFYELSLKRGSDWVYYHFTSYDNPHILREEIDQAKEDMSEEEFSQEWLGVFTKPVGIVYRDWDMESRFIKLEYDPNLPLHLSWDFGVNDPTAVVFIQPNGNEFRIIDYIERSDASLDSIISEIRSKSYPKPSLETGDIAGRSRELTTGKSPIDILRKHGHFVKTSKIPTIEDQIRNTSKFIQQLYVDEVNCQRVKDCILNYRYPTKNENLINQSNEHPIHDQYSHIMRAIEYYFWNYKPRQQQIPVYDTNKWSIR